jgi:formylglycine-generating enzyme required for sulfatase activity
MTDNDGLIAAAVLHAVSWLLLIAGYRYARELIRTPVAVLAMVASGLGSYLLVKHAEAGPVWTPEPWAGSQSTGKAIRLSFPVRQGGFGEGDGSRGRGGALPREGAGRSDDQPGEDGQPAGSGSAADDGAGSTAGRLLAALTGQGQRRAPGNGDVVKDCPHCPEIVLVPAGTFTMGAAADDREATPAELPPRAVRFWPGFGIGRYEVTVSEYRRFAIGTGRAMPACPGASAQAELETEPPRDTGRLPVTCVSAYDAAAYAFWLRQSTSRSYRLPTAAEWEYAARADTAIAVAGASPTALMRVDATSANGWGIHGMAGNLAERVADCWQQTLAQIDLEPSGCPAQVVKDGGWSEPPRWQRPSARRPIASDGRQPSIGFRVARDLR